MVADPCCDCRHDSLNFRHTAHGDAIYSGGNDYPLREAGVDSIAVRDVAETRTVMATIAAWVGNHAQ